MLFLSLSLQRCMTASTSAPRPGGCCEEVQEERPHEKKDSAIQSSPVTGQGTRAMKLHDPKQDQQNTHSMDKIMRTNKLFQATQF